MHGWLARDDSLSWTIHSVDVSPATKTRREEYHYVINTLNALGDKLHVLDAATGYTHTYHMLPYIAAACGHCVSAVDINPLTMNMPAHPLVERQVMDIGHLDYADNHFDAVVCVSVLEHMNRDHAARVIIELLRVTKGPIVLTADNAVWLPSMLAGKADIGAAWAFLEPHLDPPVYALDAIKLPP